MDDNDEGRKALIEGMEKRLSSIFNCAYEDQMDNAIIDLMEEKLSKMKDSESALVKFDGVNDDGSLGFTFKIIGEENERN